MTASTALRLFLTFLLSGWLVHAHGGELPVAVRQALDAAHIPVADVSVWVQAVDSDAPQLQLNAGRPMNPASVMKLVTAFAALDRLGPAYTWSTRLATTGRVADGVLDGSLYLTGGADPMLSYERLWKLLRQVRTLGVTTIRGDIVLDGSALQLPPHDPAAFDGRALRPYNSGAYGLLMHFNTLQLRLLPASEAGQRVGLAASPALSGLEIDNRITTAAGACGVWYGNLDATLEAGPRGPRLVLFGSLPASCGQRDWATAPLSPEQFGRALVASLWADVGGRVEGAVRSGTTPPDAAALLTETSPPLADVVREMNKWSSNVIARQLLASLGSSVPGGLDMVAGGAEVARAQLDAAGITTAGLVIENGSGLSRIERVSARTLGEILIAAWRRPFMPEFMAALPIAGQDGTARGRLYDSPARGYAHVKTGSINGVRAFAGYVLDRHGRRHAVVMLVNHVEAGSSQAAQDALMEWVWAGIADPTPAAAP
ncbi:D-alanyl-D-alanine carboxypeptidase/D-alanyl-D-alanine endopeptidase [Aromatoleum diolicum]|uniref:D-alanyl-D-alanine carboxypeptidase/D-alanyl-D-alanine-endopeptidase n=1 Tax=Aromatoleum diolicum TaxID=75796 RepID=A0ABX1Q878_9RHOO|nr:D-alanyl-D-alanine carboxypeptidase/D-alanyl-D-alanine-endopeptidase [Aromatoleum diolicum]NMG74280.1 D-alanyl-D-alanine carboxypeptidase/D-alanyl-D-alanine-endopeptidase [Aromatoleum diolicum]